VNGHRKLDAQQGPEPPPPMTHTRSRRVSVTVDLPGVLVLLLIGVFLLIGAAFAYGFWTHTLDPAVALGVASTLFTGLLGTALAARRFANGSASNHSDDGGDSREP
jgi:hypothetical protein